MSRKITASPGESTTKRALDVVAGGVVEGEVEVAEVEVAEVVGGLAAGPGSREHAAVAPNAIVASMKIVIAFARSMAKCTKA